MSANNKLPVLLLTASLSFLGGIKTQEGFTSSPVIPLKGDVPTIGNGTTVYPNGKHVTMHDKPINRKTAEFYLRDHVSKNEMQLKHSIPNVKLSQGEYDVYLDFVYQYGINKFNDSQMRVNLIKGHYTQACQSLLKYRFVRDHNHPKRKPRDCKLKKNNCRGVWTRQLNRYNKCMRAQ